MLKKEMQKLLETQASVIKSKHSKMMLLKKENDELHNIVAKQIDDLQTRCKTIDKLRDQLSAKQGELDKATEDLDLESRIAADYNASLNLTMRANSANIRRVEIQQDIISKLMKLAEVED